jgi:predicted RNA-binding protein YlqC (UPF0109 family)
MKDLVELLVRSLVTTPEEVNVTERGDDDTVVIEVKVAQGDLGKVIGKQGRVARAIRTLAKAAAARSGSQRVTVEFR